MLEKTKIDHNAIILVQTSSENSRLFYTDQDVTTVRTCRMISNNEGSRETLESEFRKCVTVSSQSSV
jgi:hypothetical protein